MRRALAACLISLTALAQPLFTSAADGSQAAPKLINFFLGYEIKADDPAKLARWDIVVLDMDQQFQFPDRVREIRALNPRVKILAYVSAGEISQARFNGHPDSPGNQLARAIPEAWLLHRADGSRVSWWAGNLVMNATSRNPSVNGQRWQTFLGPFIRDKMMPSGMWDGVFLDAAYGDITSFVGTGLDLNQDGRGEPAKEADEAWRAGMRELITNVKSTLGPGKIVISNGSITYADVANGVLIENFPRYGWAWPFQELRTSLAKNPAPKVSALNTNTENQERQNDYRLMRYGLTSALIADGYYSFDAGDAKHHRTWWYDEYTAPIGNPRAAARVVKGPAAGAYPAVWLREFDRGVVVVNATAKAEAITLPGEFERLTGSQDPRTNNGEITTRVTVPPQDGLVMIRRGDAATITGASFTNGTFMQVYDLRGTRLRNGFFASRDDVPGGATVLSVDLDRNGSTDLVYSQTGSVTVKLSGGASTTFRPYGTAYRGGIALTAGQADGDAPWELILAPSSGAPAKIVMTDTRGRVERSWLAYRAEFTGGADVSLADADGNGLREIFTSPGNGGGPHIRSFKTDGQPWRGGYFAFDSSERFGARVAMGDLDGDGRAELVVGSGPGRPPLVRVFDAFAGLQSEFSPPGVTAAQGVRPVVADVDGNGLAEILIPSSPF